jgi:hypothetical protein
MMQLHSGTTRQASTGVGAEQPPLAAPFAHERAHDVDTSPDFRA